MNGKTRIATVALAAMLFGSNAWADRPQYDYAKVISAKPIINYVNVTTPVRECWEEMEYYTVDHNRHNRRAGTFLGAVIGGVIGHQVGSGRGNDAATVAGTLIGAAIGNDAASNNDSVERRSHPVQRCETRYRAHREERIDGYRVMYRYHGQKYVTEMPYDPGKSLRVRVDIRPAG
jgi:uncharacterized protein YcfJ